LAIFRLLTKYKTIKVIPGINAVPGREAIITMGRNTISNIQLFFVCIMPELRSNIENVV